MEFVQICEQKKSNLQIALDKDGNLWKSSAAGPMAAEQNVVWEPVSFNENYRGYYPHCTFTAIAATDMDFVAAGMGEDGLPYVYRSVLGGVWESANLMAGSGLNGFVRATGKINQILYESISRQVFLLCANGELVTMPDCPKCVRVRKVTNCALVAGTIETETDKRLVLTNERGEKITLNQYEMTQVRASFSYIKEQLKMGGYVIDLRKQRAVQGDSTEESNEKLSGEHARARTLSAIRGEQYLHMELDDLEDWLESKPHDILLAFLCEYGAQADEAAHYARRHGFVKAYSLGGAGELFHVE